MSTKLSIRLAGLAALLLSTIWPAFAADDSGKMTVEERRQLIEELRQSREMTVKAVSDLTDQQLHFKPGPFRWSIAENLGHISKGEALLLNLVTQQMMQQLESGESAAPREGQPVDIEEMLRWAVARETSVQAPLRVRPDKGQSPQAALEEFLARRDEAIDFVATTDKSLHRAFRANPVFGTLDAYEWMYFTSGHARRHLAQIDEVKAHPDYPGGDLKVWQGTVENPPFEFRLAVQHSSGRIEAQLDIPSRNIHSLELEQIEFDGQMLKFVVPNPDQPILCEAKRNEDGSFSGTYRLGDQSGNFTMKPLGN